MIELPVTLTSTGGAVSFASPVPLGYTKNKGVYRLLVTAEGEWEGLTIRCFWHLPSGSDPASSLVQDGAVDVPASVTAHPGNGCITFEGSDGVKTVTSADLRYRVGSNSGTEDGTMPEPGTPAWEQLVSDTAVALEAVQKQIGNLDDLTTKAKETLVAAINEAARTGSGGAGSITMRTDGGYIQYSTDDGSTWKNLIALAELKGEPGQNGADGAPGQNGADGAPGADGYSPTASVEQSTDGAKITITDKSGTTEAVVKNGKDGANGRDGADGQPGRDGTDGAPGRDGVDGQPGKDGTDGITPTIGDNGNWYLGDTDTGKPSRGETGPQGPQGEQGPTGATGPQGPKGDTGATGADGKSAYQYAQDGGYTGTETEFAAKIAEELPNKLPNPNALTFTGAVTGSYDGSEAMTVDIPSGGGASAEWKKVAEIITEEDSTYISVTEDSEGNPLSFDEAFVGVMTARPSSASSNGHFVISAMPNWVSSFEGHGIYNFNLWGDVYAVMCHVRLLGNGFVKITSTPQKHIGKSLHGTLGFISELFDIVSKRQGWNFTDKSIMGCNYAQNILDENGKLHGITVGVDMASSIKMGAGTRLEVWVR